MVRSYLPVVPRWLAMGLLLGLLLATVVAVIFVLGRTVFPAHLRRSTPGEERFSGDTRKRRAVARYLAALGEPYEEHVTVLGRRVAFYLPERDVAITFDPLTYYRLLRSTVTPVLVEHEMPVSHLGARFPFDTGPPGASSSGEPLDAAVHTALSTLGLDASAGPADVRTAYRDRVKAVHPDHGGDRASFVRIHDAYRVASRALEER